MKREEGELLSLEMKEKKKREQPLQEHRRKKRQPEKGR